MLNLIEKKKIKKKKHGTCDTFRRIKNIYDKRGWKRPRIQFYDGFIKCKINLRLKNLRCKDLDPPRRVRRKIEIFQLCPTVM